MPLIATQRHADRQTIVPSSVADSYRATKIRAQGVEWPVIRGHRALANPQQHAGAARVGWQPQGGRGWCRLNGL